MKQYSVFYGATVPWQRQEFSNYAHAAAFIKQQLDAGVPVRSVSKEHCDDEEQRDGL